MVRRLVVVGASLAGLRAVEAARRAGFDGEVVLVGDEAHLPYDRPPLSKAYLADETPSEPWFRTADHLRDELGVTLMLGTPASGLDAERQVLRVGDAEVRYDALVIATGATARRWPGTEELGGVHPLRTLDDARSVRAALDAGARTVVVGAGFIGSEVAAGARKRGLDVTIVEALDVPLSRSVGTEIGEACTQLHREQGTDLRCGVTVTGFEERDGAVTAVRLSDGSTVAADLVVVGIGVIPNTGWLAGSGVRLHERDGGIVCDESLWTGVPGVYAAGDVMHWPNPLFDGEVMRLEHWTTAAEQGACAARNAIEPGRDEALSTVPYFWSDWYDHRIQFVGIPRADEVRVVSAEQDDDRFLALYRRGDRLVGVLSVDRPTQIMKYRRLIVNRASWTEALEFAGVSTQQAVTR
ncbi:FAD-dependent oxidoreductase [Nocardioides dubius]|uniref:FAD-dependent oxidoreductase n=1 Tax=Nocardioides dubius TaxID=317019 RepID=A0ABN1TZJ5_9ACTN